jgi:hypothetical protein
VTFEEFVTAVDALVVGGKPGFEYAFTENVRTDPRRATWLQIGGMVTLFGMNGRVRLLALPLVVDPQPMPNSTQADRERFAAQEKHRFEYWVEARTEDVGRVAKDIVKHLEGPAFG